MSIGSADDLEGLRRAAHVTRLTLDALERRVRAGVSTAQLDAVAATIFDKHRARSAPAMVYNFPGHVLISVNDEIVHGVPGTRILRRGDLVKVDVTVEKDGYFADAARTVIVGSAGDTARRLAACVRAAFRAGAKVARAGTPVKEIGRAVQTVVEREGFAVVRGLAGHGIGRTIHEEPTVPNTYDRWQKDVLTEGLVITIEPMIAAGSSRPVEAGDGWTIRTADGSLSAHHEHTLVITRTEPLILTAA
jgi:methionyl aminopeptidase